MLIKFENKAMKYKPAKIMLFKILRLKNVIIFAYYIWLMFKVKGGEILNYKVLRLSREICIFSLTIICEIDFYFHYTNSNSTGLITILNII